MQFFSLSKNRSERNRTPKEFSDSNLGKYILNNCRHYCAWLSIAVTIASQLNNASHYRSDSWQTRCLHSLFCQWWRTIMQLRNKSARWDECMMGQGKERTAREGGYETIVISRLKRARKDSRSRFAIRFSIREERNRKLYFALVPKLVIRVGYPGDLC